MAYSSLSIGTGIREILMDDHSFQVLCGKIYPVIVPSEVSLPYATYRRTAIEVKPTKSGYTADTITVEICCFADTYQRAIQIAETVRLVLENRAGDWGYSNIRSILLVNGEEGYQDDAFVQQLVFQIKTS